MRYLLLVIVFIGCKSAEKIAAERAAKEEISRQQEIALIEKTRQRYPCDTFRIKEVDTMFNFVPGDTIKIGEAYYIHDTSYIKRTVTKYVVDSAWIQQYRDSLASANYAFDLARQDAAEQNKKAIQAEAKFQQTKADKSYWQRSALITWGIAFLLVGGAVFSKIKGII